MQPPLKVKRSPNVIPPSLENEIYYFFTYIHPHVTFEDFVRGCPEGLFGPARSDLRVKVTTFYDKIRRSQDYNRRKHAAFRNITGEQAPFAHQYFLNHIEGSQQASQNMRGNNNDNKSYSEESDFDLDGDGYDGNYVPTPPKPFGDRNHHHTSSDSSVGGKLALRADFDMLALADHDFCNGIPFGMDVPMLRYVLKKLNTVVALDLKDPSSLPVGVDFILVKDAPTRKTDLSYDKLIRVLQVSDMESLSYISARLSKDGKVIIVEAPVKER
jgi:hypothetical protein